MMAVLQRLCYVKIKHGDDSAVRTRGRAELAHVRPLLSTCMYEYGIGRDLLIVLLLLHAISDGAS